MRSLALAAALCLGALASAAAAAAPLVIGHRGASGERPEHTAAAYRLAIAEGADFIESDLVMTKDGQLLVRHENEIGATTDVAAHPEFAARKTVKIVDGRRIEGWFSEDFTLAELRTLRARERLPDLRPANAAFDGQERLLTLAEVVDLARAEGRKAHRTVGIYAELKHPTYFAGIGLPMEDRLINVIRAKGLARPDAAFILECFELQALSNVRAKVRVKSVFLMDAAGVPADAAARGDPRSYRELARPNGLRAVAAVADGIGPDKSMIVPRDAAGRSLPATTLVADAHAADLFVHPYTFRSENSFLPAELRRGDPPANSGYAGRKGDAASEYLTFYRLGVDGVFSDFPAEAVAARRQFSPSAAGAGRSTRGPGEGRVR